MTITAPGGFVSPTYHTARAIDEAIVLHEVLPVFRAVRGKIDFREPAVKWAEARELRVARLAPARRDRMAVAVSPRIPGSHDRPLERLDDQMTEADVVKFAELIHSGFNGQAQWRRKGNHEELVIWMLPQAVNYLPPGVTVVAVGNRYNRDGMVQFLLARDWDTERVKVVRSGVREETTIYTTPPEEGT